MAITTRSSKEGPQARKGLRRLFQYDHFFAWFWIAPAVIFVGAFLVYPTIDTVISSFENSNSSSFVGLENYQKIFTDGNMLDVLKNNLLWLVVATIGCVALGLLIAVLVDRVRIESAIKSAIFIPMAISFVGASVIWKFVYDYESPGQPQIGLLNAVRAAFGQQPVGWLVTSPIDNLAMIIIYVWIWTGFCMVIISAALKGVPAEILESARCDGASPSTIFFRIIMPMISPTLLVVITTMVINVLKIFDIVYTLTGGDFNTNVVAMAFYQQMFTNFDFGRASALALLLMLVVIPIMVINVRRFRSQEARR